MLLRVAARGQGRFMSSLPDHQVVGLPAVCSSSYPYAH